MYFTPRDAIKFKKPKHKHNALMIPQQQATQIMQQTTALDQRKVSISNNAAIATYMNSTGMNFNPGATMTN